MRFFLCGLVFLAFWVFFSASLWAQGLVVLKTSVAQKELSMSDTQIVQVLLENRGERGMQVGALFKLSSSGGYPVPLEQRKKVYVKPKAQKRVFFEFGAPSLAGSYKAEVVFYNTSFTRPVLENNPVYQATFEVIEAKEELTELLEEGFAEEFEALPPEETEQPTSDVFVQRRLKFDPPELLWENPKMESHEILRGERVLFRGDVWNVGGDVAQNIELQGLYYDPKVPTKLYPIFFPAIPFLAPGENLELEVPFYFNDEVPLGDYRLQFLIDPNNQIVEGDEENNLYEFLQGVSLYDIILLFPQEGFVFESSELFLFRWKTNKYQEFKVQIGVEESFGSEQEFFEFPQGKDKWAAEKELSPLQGEWYGILANMLLLQGGEKVYWRVLAREKGSQEFFYSSVGSFVLSID